MIVKSVGAIYPFPRQINPLALNTLKLIKNSIGIIEWEPPLIAATTGWT